MLKYLVRRTAVALAFVVLVSSPALRLVGLAPGDYASDLFGGIGADPALVAAARAREGLDRPLPAQYAAWLRRPPRPRFWRPPRPPPAGGAVLPAGGAPASARAAAGLRGRPHRLAARRRHDVGGGGRARGSGGGGWRLVAGGA